MNRNKKQQKVLIVQVAATLLKWVLIQKYEIGLIVCRYRESQHRQVKRAKNKLNI